MNIFYQYWKDARGRWRGHHVKKESGKFLWVTPKFKSLIDPAEIGPSELAQQNDKTI